MWISIWWILIEPSRFLIGRHTPGGFLDNASAFAFVRLSLYWISNSKSDNFSFHFQILDVGSSMEFIHTNGLWSVTIANFLPYRYGLKCIVQYTIARHSFSMVEYFCSAGFSNLKAYAISKSFPIGPWLNTPPIAYPDASVVPAGRARLYEPMGTGKPTFPKPGGTIGTSVPLTWVPYVLCREGHRECKAFNYGYILSTWPWIVAHPRFWSLMGLVGISSRVQCTLRPSFTWVPSGTAELGYQVAGR